MSLSCRRVGAMNLADVVACLDEPRAAIDVVDLLGLDEWTARATLRRARRLGLAGVVGVRSYPAGRPALLWMKVTNPPDDSSTDQAEIVREPTAPRESLDVALSRWLSERCANGGRASSSALYADFCAWAASSGCRCTHRAFSLALGARFESMKSNTMVYVGITLLERQTSDVST